MKSKEELRGMIRARKKLHAVSEREAASRSIVVALRERPELREARAVGLYLSLADEVCLDPLLADLHAAGKSTAVPIFNAATAAYDMARVTGSTEFESAKYGVREPRSPLLFELARLDVLIVPGLAFDHRLHRLGRGGGYYDRLLETFRGVVIGVAFDFQIVDRLPVEPHDRPAHLVLTESRSIEI